MIYALFCLYAHIHGQTNAFLYSVKGAESLPANEHRWLVLERCCLALAPLLMLFYPNETSPALLLVLGELIAAAFAFSFWHNRAYYLMRDKVDKTAYGGRYTSTSSTAATTFTYTQRRAMLFISFGVLFITAALYIYLYA